MGKVCSTAILISHIPGVAVMLDWPRTSSNDRHRRSISRFAFLSVVHESQVGRQFFFSDISGLSVRENEKWHLHLPLGAYSRPRFANTPDVARKERQLESPPTWQPLKNSSGCHLPILKPPVSAPRPCVPFDDRPLVSRIGLYCMDF